MDISAVEEVFGIREMTVRTWLACGGAHGQKLHQRFFANLDLAHVQLDELWANVKRSHQDIWVWVDCESKYKLIPVLQLGPRTQNMAYSVVHELKSRLKPGCVPIFSSDGLKHYFYALTAHFGEWLKTNEQAKPIWNILADFAYAQVIKQQWRFRLIKVEHRNLWGTAAEYAARLKACGLSDNINTSFVERVNLTIRQCVSKLTRRTWGPANIVWSCLSIILVTDLLSLRQNPPRIACEIGDTGCAKRIAIAHTLSQDDPCSRRWNNQQVMVGAAID